METTTAPITPDYTNDPESYFFESPDYISTARAEFLLSLHSMTFSDLFEAEPWLRGARTDQGWRTNQLAYALGY
jgi:hypothetical protein